MSADRVERIWRSAVGTTHGKHWPEFEFHDRVDAGDGLSYTPPKVEAISDVLIVAEKVLAAGVALFTMRAGHWENRDKLWDEATLRLAQRMTTANGEPISVEDVPNFRTTSFSATSRFESRA